MEFNHELILPNEDLPFKMFLFEGKDGNYYRDKHWHRSVEIFAVFEGEMDFYLNDECFPLHSGEFILVNSNEIHSINVPNPNKTVVIQMPLKTFEDYFTGEQFIRFSHSSRAQDSKILELVQEMFETYEKKECGYEMKVKGLYFMILYLLVTEYRELEVTDDQLKRNRKLDRLSMITTYIKENYASELTLEDLAKIFGYSPYYLSKMFQKYAGINYKAYLQSVRVENAYKEMANSDHTISEVAMNNGFPSSKAFAKAFSKKYGLLPSEYRKLKQVKK